MTNEVDIARVKRILGMLQAQPLDVGKSEGLTFRGAHLTATYNQLRDEVMQILPAGLTEEFERLHEPLKPPPGNLHDLFGQQAATQRALGALTNLKGWLRGVVDEG